MIGFGVLMGIFGYAITLIVDVIDLSEIEELLSSLPELQELLDLFGDLNSPYALLNVEVFAFFWIFVGFFFVYVTSSSVLPGEVEDKTIDLILSKPISRSSYLMSKVAFLYIFIIIVQAIIFGLIGLGMSTSQSFIDFGLFWDRLLLFATITLSSKRTMAAALAVMFVMFFLGTFWGFFAEDLQVFKYISTWFYLNTEDLFVNGIFDNLFRDLFVLLGVNLSLIISSVLIFRRRDIPV
jgi:ABC-2 type transport system permease protein